MIAYKVIQGRYICTMVQIGIHTARLWYKSERRRFSLEKIERGYATFDVQNMASVSRCHRRKSREEDDTFDTKRMAWPQIGLRLPSEKVVERKVWYIDTSYGVGLKTPQNQISFQCYREGRSCISAVETDRFSANARSGELAPLAVCAC